MSYKVTVIIPVYNVKDYLRECLESVVSQTLDDIEVILVNDGSTDGSDLIAHEYEQRYPHIRMISQENQGLGAARNAGLKMAGGEYVYFLDSDDYVDPELLERTFQIAKKERLDCILFDGIEVTDGIKTGSLERRNLGITDEVITGIDFWDRYYKIGGVIVCAVLFLCRTDFLLQNQLFFWTGVLYEDNDWSMRMLSLAKRVRYLPQNFYYYRMRKDSITGMSFTAFHLQSCIEIYKKLLRLEEDQNDVFPVRMVEAVKSIISGRCSEILNYFMTVGREHEVSELVHEALSYINSCGPDCEENLFRLGRIKNEYRELLPKTDQVRLDRLISEGVEKAMHDLSLNRNGLRIGIYGLGKVCDILLSLCQKYESTIGENVCFIDGKKETGADYHGHFVYNINDIEEAGLDRLFITSTKYADKMQAEAEKRLGGNLDIQRIGERVMRLYDLVQPTISVIVPVYNVEKYLVQCVDSIRNQEYSDLQIVLVDDGSTDRSGEICDEYAAIDPRVVVIHQQNGGLVRARKAGLAAAEGRYIGFVDSDDHISPKMYQNLLLGIKRSGAGFIHSGYMEEGAPIVLHEREDIDISESKGNFLREAVIGPAPYIYASIWSKLFKAGLIKKCYAKVPDDCSFGEDYINLCACIMEADKISITDSADYNYRIRTGSLTNSTDAELSEKIKKMYDSMCSILNEYGHYDELKKDMTDFFELQMQNNGIA